MKADTTMRSVEAVAKAPVLTPSEVAREWGCSLEHVMELIRSGHIKAFDVGGIVRIRRDTLCPKIPEPKGGSFVYIVRAGGFIKIGHTTKLTSRMNNIRTHSPYDVTLLHKLAGARVLEKELHQRFAAQHSRNEWFREEGELAAWIAMGFPGSALQ